MTNPTTLPRTAPRPCKHCGENFVPAPKGKISQYCSRTCWEAGRYSSVKIQGPRPCKYCGENFVPAPVRGRDPLYCTDRCRKDSHRATREAALPPIAPRDCDHCGSRYTPASRLPSKYCSTKCLRRAGADARLMRLRLERDTWSERVPCENCGSDFVLTSSNPLRRHCSARCRDHTGNRRRVYTPKTYEPIPCNYCGKIFTPPRFGTGGPRTCCSPEHQREYRMERIWASNHRRREIMTAPDAEKFLFKDIFERDKWVCQLCNEPVDRDAKYPDPLSRSLDHILPLSRGGRHKESNAQLAHLGCNISKGNRVPALAA